MSEQLQPKMLSIGRPGAGGRPFCLMRIIFFQMIFSQRIVTTASDHNCLAVVTLRRTRSDDADAAAAAAAAELATGDQSANSFNSKQSQR
jgi:hypothetical protein